jgi:hypothetical protein
MCFWVRGNYHATVLSRKRKFIIRSEKLSNAESGQHLDGWPAGKPHSVHS